MNKLVWWSFTIKIKIFKVTLHQAIKINYLQIKQFSEYCENIFDHHLFFFFLKNCV